VKRRDFCKSLALVTSASAFPYLSFAQGRAIRIIVPFSAGSGSDDGARFYAEQLSKTIRRPVIVENKPGASGLLAVKEVIGQPADGNTILLGSNSLISVNPVVVKNLGYDPFKQLLPLHGLAISSPAVLTGNDSGINSFADLVARYKSRQEPVSIGNYSEGYRLVGEWLSQALNIKSIPVPYKGGAAMVTDVIGNRLDIGLNDITGVAPLEKARKIKVLAITGKERDHLLPNIPTMRELGYPEMESYVWSAFSMKAGTSRSIMEELATAISESQKTNEAKEYQSARAGKFLDKKLEELGEFQRAEYERFKKVAEKAKIKPA
jgi:tripartite-type tricarboxylate transporter receptor subunit TctC